MCAPDELVFIGCVASGIGCHSSLDIPGREGITGEHNDWPLRLYPGSLNIMVSGYPAQLAGMGLKSEVAVLDQGLFVPAFVIPGTALSNNKLRPRQLEPKRGDAQVWRAFISKYGHAVFVKCWALRRFGSGVGEQLELVSDERLRDHGFQDGDLVAVSLYGRWKDA